MSSNDFNEIIRDFTMISPDELLETLKTDQLEDDDDFYATLDDSFLNYLTSASDASADEKKMQSQLKKEEDGVASRFKTLSTETINAFEHAHQAKRTKENTKWALKMFQEWHSHSYGDQLDFSTTSEEDLAQILRKFYCEAAPKASQARVKQLGDAAAGTYHKNTLKNIRSALNRHLADIGRTVDIVHGVAFRSANRTLDGFLKQQTKSGMSRPTLHKNVLEKSDLQKIASYFESGINSPIVLRQCVWYNLAIHFVSRGIEFHHQLRLNSFDYHVDDGTEYVTIKHETQQKNFQGGLSKDESPVDKRMYATGTSTCPVGTLKLLIAKTDPSAKSLFNKCEKEALVCPATIPLWYNAKALSQRSFVNFMSDICKGSNTTGWYTAHCLRVTAILALNDSGFATRHMTFMSGHKSDESLKSYCRQPSTDQKRALSKTLSTLISTKPDVKSPAGSIIPRATSCTATSSSPEAEEIKPIPESKSSSNPDISSVVGGSFQGCSFHITINK